MEINSENINVAEMIVGNIKAIQNLKPASFAEVQHYYSLELARSIIRMLKKLDVKPDEIFAYDEKLARYRGLEGSFGVSYHEYDCLKDVNMGGDFGLDGKGYCLWTYWPEPNDVFGPDGINCAILQIGIGDFEHIYNYLRMELALPRAKRRFKIVDKEMTNLRDWHHSRQKNKALRRKEKDQESNV